MNVLAYGGITTVIGLFIVFLGLAILIGAVSVMAAIFKKIDKNKAEKAEAAARLAAAQAPKAAPAPVPAPVEEVVEEDDPALIAVIAAAIAAYDDSGKRLVVRRVRRVPAWNARSHSRF